MIYFKKIFFLTILTLSFHCLGVPVEASTGFIDTSATNTVKVCKDPTCISPAPGVINFELTSQPSIVVDSVTGISGKVWGSELGWITMNPTGQGVTFADTSTGRLTGKAWSQVSGWINFSTTGQNVFINPLTGEFGGWAWTGGPYGGWIKFDCGNSSTCVRTTWREENKPPVRPYPLSLIDVCPNIPNSQQTLPVGYTVDQNGDCIIVPPDLCPNILGEQSQVPRGYYLDSIGACSIDFIDFCPNIKGNQNKIPLGQIVDDSGNCILRTKHDLCPSIVGVQTSYDKCSKVPVSEDICLNLPGLQAIIPFGYQGVNNNECLPETFDVCPNIPDTQTNTPEGQTIGANGDCIPTPSDLCRNLPGIQSEIPKSFYPQEGLCIFRGQTKNVDTSFPDGVRVVAFDFIPKSLQIASNNFIPKIFVKGFDVVTGDRITEKPYRVDMVSFGIGVIGSIILLINMFLLLRFVRLRRFLV